VALAKYFEVNYRNKNHHNKIKSLKIFTTRCDRKNGGSVKRENFKNKLKIHKKIVRFFE